MMTDSANDCFKGVVDESAHRLRSLGFHRRGNTLRKIVGDAVAIIEFQKSTKSSSDSLSFTVNLAIFAAKLIEDAPPSLARAGSVDAQFRARLGMLLPGRSDKWWDVDSRTDGAALASEIAALLASTAVPYLEQYMNMDELVALWESGNSPGLTETQRSRYLARAHDLGARGK